RAGAAVQRDAVEDGAHRVLADAEVQVAPVGGGAPRAGGDLLRAERLLALDDRVVGAREVGRTAPQLRQGRTERLQRRFRGLARGDALGVRLPRRQVGVSALRQGAGGEAVEERAALRVAPRPGVEGLLPHGAGLLRALAE